jgi:alpha-L-fucosidase 2
VARFDPLPSSTEPNRRLWNDTPAAEWLSAFPIGNGQLGGMVFGGVGHERIGLNHERLWRGVTRDRTVPDVAAGLPRIRAAFFGGDMAEGARLAEEVLGGHGRRIMPYQPVGDLTIDLPGAPAIDDLDGYERELDLVTGVAATTWEQENHVWRRLAFMSADHNALVINLQTTDPQGISARIGLSRRESDDLPDRPEGASLHGEHGSVTPWPRRDWYNDDEIDVTTWSRSNRAGLFGLFTEGISFATELRVFSEGGTVTNVGAELATLDVVASRAVTIVLSIMVKTESHLMNARDAIASHLDAVPSRFEQLLETHLFEHLPAMERVSLSLPAPPEAALLPLDARLDRLRAGHDDPGLVSLWFHYGRYLLYSSSRRCHEPANLQGIWSEELDPAWQSDYHLNINLQMNYWPAESTNLPECLPPFLSFLERFIPSALEAARHLYGVEGIVLPHATDVWGRATPEAPVCDVWQGAASWLGQHFWWHWLYTGDREFLARSAYPWLKRCAEFWTGFLVPEQRDDHPLHGQLVSVPSNSPENSYWWEGHKLRYGIGATMDLLLARETLEHCLQASTELDLDDDLRPGWQAIIDRLAPLQIGKHGQLQEYVDDWDEPEPSHRHVSHLYGVYPGESLTEESTPELFAAARVSLERRLAHGGGHTGWSRSWVAALWARFGEGDLAAHHLDELIRQFATDALLDLHPPRIFQIDGNLGGTAAIAEMLLRSSNGRIHLLPALPTGWPDGAVRGLRARGGKTVSIGWRGGRFGWSQLTSTNAEPVALVVSATVDVRITVIGGPRDGHVVTPVNERGALVWTPIPGDVYEIRPTSPGA